MKGLLQIPGAGNLEAAYALLQGDRAITETQYALFSQWGRFDPRLAEQVVSALVRDWKTLSPVVFNHELLKQPWPAAMGVLFEMLRYHQHWLKSETAQLNFWSQCVMAEIPLGHDENYFIGTRSFAGKGAFDDAVLSIKAYRKWGFFGRDLLINKESGEHTLVSSDARHVAIVSLLLEKKVFTVNDYIQKLGGDIGRRQAQRDLRKFPRLKAFGSTRSRNYRRTKP